MITMDTYVVEYNNITERTRTYYSKLLTTESLKHPCHCVIFHN